MTDTVGHCRTLSDTVGHCRDTVGHCRTLSTLTLSDNNVGHCRTLSDHVGHCRTLWLSDTVGLGRTMSDNAWLDTGLDTENVGQ